MSTEPESKTSSSTSGEATGAQFPENEVRLVEHWRRNDIAGKALEKRRKSNRGTFIFYEGPPTANGLPHPGHCLTRAIKDLYPRYKSMKGFLCERRAGWDTHGLPVEVEVCKELGIHSKEQIEEYGVEPFVHRCIENVFRYTKQWEELTERIGFWIDLDKAYVTFHKSYVESVWWALSSLFKRGLLYQGHKIVWWWAQGGTALSSGEVGQGYRQVADPSVFVRFPLLPGQGDSRLDEVDLLVWTTTPWTLPSNQFAAVHPDLEYSVVDYVDEAGASYGRKVIVASALVAAIAGKIKRTAKIIATLSGKELIGLRYRPPFDCYYKDLGEKRGTLLSGESEFCAWRVCPANFVTTDAGSGLVHEAPAFGEVDFDLLVSEQSRFVEGDGPELICAVAPNGTFTEVFSQCAGRWVKDCDKDLCHDLKSRGLLFLQEQYLHDYPFCWRASSDPLIQYPRRSWFIRTTSFKEKMLENNEQIGWYPEHIKSGRFGNFLETNVDWALSRERYWGTPLPVWVCEETGYMESIASFDELLGKPGVTGMEAWSEAKASAQAAAGKDWSDREEQIWEHLKVHKPYIDAITWESPKAPGKRMRRVGEVIDCWFDSGSMPFAQLGYPHLPNSEKEFADNFPADFISEAIDQTRGWFYSQLAISTLLFGEKREYPHPFRNCIVLGLMLGEDGQKMSKSLRNYREPREIFDKYGADALRWYFYANQTPWTSIRYSESAIRDSMPEFMIRLWNVCTFFDVYRKIDGFAPESLVDLNVMKELGGELTAEVFATASSSSAPYRPVEQRNELDRWILSELNETIAIVTDRMDHYDHFAACGRLNEFVDSLSNWYVRRSRDRFWSGEELTSKADAYWTLYESLVTLARLIAPFVPFLAERMWHSLAVAAFGSACCESVHLCDYPVAREELIDHTLSHRMRLVREIVSLGRNARMGSRLKVRQPLAAIEVVLTDPGMKSELVSQIPLMKEELNVKEINFIDKADRYISYSVVPDFKKLGPKLGRNLPKVKGYLSTADASVLLASMTERGVISIPLDGEEIELSSDEVQIRLQSKDGFAAAQGSGAVVVLSTDLTAELLAEGRAREIVRIIQDRRKDLQCDYTDRIDVGFETSSEAILAACRDYAEYIKGETLAVSLVEGCPEDVAALETKVDGALLKVAVRVHGV
ncbi:MAG: isoleucine--tRNA ligase [Planctomycetia bacterium]|nr:isoleucine--tRNA ligase [Planctomycetia bacterium]